MKSVCLVASLRKFFGDILPTRIAGIIDSRKKEKNARKRAK